MTTRPMNDLNSASETCQERGLQMGGNMKKLLSMLMILAIVFTLAIPVFADAMDMKTVDSVLQEIQKVQNVTDVKSIDIEKVTPDQLDELGDVVMGKLIGDNERHDWMDRMIGGDGSESLKNFHMNLGYRYLKGEPLTIQSMMMGSQEIGTEKDANRSEKYGMMGFRNGFGMMNSPWYGIGGITMGLLVLILVIAAISLFIKRSGSPVSAVSSLSAVEILKQRYAKGEITHDEFEKMKNNLEQKIT